MSEESNDSDNEIMDVEELEEKIYDMKDSVVRLSEGKDSASGFFCKIYINDSPMPALITCYHIINAEYIKNNSHLYFTDRNNIPKKINLKFKRMIYTNKDLDVTIIEIKEEDNLDIYSFLEMDNSINSKNPNILYKKVYLFHYPLGKTKVKFSKGSTIKIIDNNYNFINNYKSKKGSSGAAIIDYNTDLVIGIHQGKYELIDPKQSQGILLKYAVEEFIKEKSKEIQSTYKNLYPYSNTMIMIYNIPNNDGIKLFSEKFVCRYKNVCKYIYNEKEYPLTQYFQLTKITKEDKIKGEIKITLTNFDYIKNMDFMFSRCEDLKKVIVTGTDFSKIESMDSTFDRCENLEELSNTSKLNVENVKTFKGLFYLCKKLAKIPGIRKWKPYNLENFYEMFLGCQSNLILSEISTIDNWRNISKKAIKGDYMKGFGIENLASYLCGENLGESLKVVANRITNIISKKK